MHWNTVVRIVFFFLKKDSEDSKSEKEVWEKMDPGMTPFVS